MTRIAYSRRRHATLAAVATVPMTGPSTSEHILPMTREVRVLEDARLLVCLGPTWGLTLRGRTLLMDWNERCGGAA